MHRLFETNHKDHNKISANENFATHCEVAAGIIWNKSRILIAKRRSNDTLGGLWEFPGGKKKQGESLEACLIREIKEELGILIKVGEFAAKIEHRFDNVLITLNFFYCQLLQGVPQAFECDEWRWITPEEFKYFNFRLDPRKKIK